jgi:hypothetical protein
MSKRIWTKAGIAAGAAIAIALALAASTVARADYSGRVGRQACRSAGACTVYDARGRHEVPCWPTKTAVAYPGDPGWPFEAGVCDTVAQMSAPWPEGSDAAHPINTTTTAASQAVARP